MLKNLMNKKKKGFTLVELIIVIAIIAILVAIAVPQFGKIRAKANVSSDMANAKSLYSAIAACVADETLLPTEGTDAEPVKIEDKDLVEYLGGQNNIPKPKAYQGSEFKYSITDGEIKVFVKTTQEDAPNDGLIEIYPGVTSKSKYEK